MITFETIVKKIKAYDTIIIHRHINPDPDALGSQLGLAQIIRDNFSKTVYCVGSELEGLHWIGRMDSISDDVYTDALVIVVDTANTERIDDARYVLGKELIKIDHHPNVEPYTELLYVDTTASSASEIICDLAFDQQMILSQQAAEYIYTGIIGDTNRFLYNNATAKTMAIVARLRLIDFDNVAIHNHMLEKTLKQARLNGYVLQNITVDTSGVAFIVLTQSILKQQACKMEDAESVTSLPSGVDCIKAWAIFIEKEDGTYRVRLRSKGPIINELAARHHGGGHPLASGANAKDYKEVEQIIEELIELVNRG